MPGRSTRFGFLFGLTRIFTGMRCTTLMKLPVAFCGGSKACREPAGAGDGIDHAFEFLAVGVHVKTNFLAGDDVGQLGFLEIRGDVHLIERNDGEQQLARAKRIAPGPRTSA